MGSSLEEADETINLCAHCRRRAAHMCIGCHKAPDNEGGQVDTIWYCNAACQKKDWKFHKFECRASQARKAFYRAGQTVQLAYYGLVEQLFDMSAVKVKAQGNILYVYEGTDNGKLNSTLPNQDFGNEDKHAILSWMDSGSSEKYFQVLVNAMLQDIRFKVSEVVLFAVKYRRQVVTINADGVQIDNPHSRHKLLQFTINGDEVYALDLGGAQHGFYEPVSPWKKCLEERVAAIEYIRPMAHIRESRDLSSGESTGNWSIARQAFNTKALSETLASAAKSWQVENGSLSAMLKLREEAFGRRQGELLDFIGKRVREAKGK